MSPDPGTPCASGDGGRSPRTLKIAMIGQRGVPASWGGIERHVEEIGARLAERGHHVVVFNRPNYVKSKATTYRGMHLRTIPTVTSKHFEALVHSALSSAATLGRGFDIVHYHALGPGLWAPIPKYLSHARAVETIHGLDNERAKWGGMARRVLDAGLWMSAHVPDATVVVAKGLVDYYQAAHGAAVHYIPNGVVPPVRRDPDLITQHFGLRGNDYILFVGRLVPEKAPDDLLRAFAQLSGTTKLVLAGGSSYTSEFVERLHQLAEADPRVVMPGYVHGPLLEELYSNAAAFALPSTLEGLPLTLLEAIAAGRPVVASRIPPHVEILGDQSGASARLVEPNDIDGLQQALDSILSDPDAHRDAAFRASCVLERYDWDVVTAQTEDLYLQLLDRNG